MHTYLPLRRSDGIRKPKERQCNIHKTVLVLFQILFTIDNLVELETHKTSDKRRRGRNRRNDLSGNLFGGMTIGSSDAVVHGTEVGCRSDEINVMVRVLVLFKVNRFKTETNQTRWWWKRVFQGFEFIWMRRSMVHRLGESNEGVFLTSCTKKVSLHEKRFNIACG